MNRKRKKLRFFFYKKSESYEYFQVLYKSLSKNRIFKKRKKNNVWHTLHNILNIEPYWSKQFLGSNVNHNKRIIGEKSFTQINNISDQICHFIMTNISLIQYTDYF